MLELCKDKCYLMPQKDRISKLMTSFNQPMVAPSQHHAQPTKAYICIYREDEGFSVYVYLYLTVDKDGLLYRYPGIFSSPDECSEAEDEAMQFAETMGFMVDDLKFQYMDTSDQERLLATIALFAVPPHQTVGEMKEFEEAPAVLEETVNAEQFDVNAVTLEEKAEVPEKTEDKNPLAMKVVQKEAEKVPEAERLEPVISLSKFRMRRSRRR